METEEATKKFALFAKRNSFLLLLVLFVSVDMFSYALLFSQNNQITKRKNFIPKYSLVNFDVNNIPKISNIKSSRIDDRAASIEKRTYNNFEEKKSYHSYLPIKMWVFLFLVYVALLIFNLAYNFNYAVKPQWFWELLYTLLAVTTWYLFDQCKENIWYPVFILKSGSLIYAVYLYFFTKKQKQFSLL